MNIIFRCLTVPALCVALSAAAQTPAAAPPANVLDATAPLPASPRIERLTHEDALSRVDELRVGGQTQRIEVQPKNGAPAYQIQPEPAQSAGQDSAAQPNGTAGRSSWRILSF